jgi:hypothetical protein
VKKSWLQDKDGTYYRNCPLIMAERKRAIFRRGALSREWRETYIIGVQRKDTLGPRDVLVQPRSFRESYPDHPGLWRLDEETT